MQEGTELRRGGTSPPCSPERALLEGRSAMDLFLRKENTAWETTTWKQGAALPAQPARSEGSWI